MRVERRGRIVLICLVVNRCFREEPGERIEVVQYFQAGGFRGLSKGEGEQGRGGSGRGIDRGVRTGPEREPVQIAESDVVRELFPAAGAYGGNTEVRWKWGQGPRGTYCRGQNRANGGGHVPGAGRGEGLPPGPRKGHWWGAVTCGFVAV